MEVIPKQWFSTLQLLPKDFRKVLMGQISSTNHLACKWGVKMKEEESIKGEGGSERKGSRNQESNTVAIRNQHHNQTYGKYIKTDLIGLC